MTRRDTTIQAICAAILKSVQITSDHRFTHRAFIRS